MKHDKIFIDGKYVPTRMCISCRKLNNKNDMIRVAKMKDGSIFINNNEGRGVYICKDEKCLLLLQKNNGLSRGLKTNVPLSVYEECLKFVE